MHYNLKHLANMKFHPTFMSFIEFKTISFEKNIQNNWSITLHGAQTEWHYLKFLFVNESFSNSEYMLTRYIKTWPTIILNQQFGFSMTSKPLVSSNNPKILLPVVTIFEKMEEFWYIQTRAVSAIFKLATPG